MAKLYSRKKLVPQLMLPKKETVYFLLNFSKALTTNRIGNVLIEIIAN